jgi:glycerophosphoryl diester phosphodiesterase
MYNGAGLVSAVDLKAGNVEQEVVRLAEKHGVLDRLLSIGRTISEPKVRDRIRSISPEAHTAAVANNMEEFPTALASTDADWVYFRYLPPKRQMDAVKSEGKRAFIAGATVSGNLPEN